VRGAVVLLRQLFLSLHHLAGEANDHVVLIGLSVDRDGSECGASDLHGLILVPKCQCPSQKISYSHFDSRSMRDSRRDHCKIASDMDSRCPHVRSYCLISRVLMCMRELAARRAYKDVMLERNHVADAGGEGCARAR